MMNCSLHITKRTVAGALLSGVTALATLDWAATGVAEARPIAPMPLNAWPGCPNGHPEGPCHWCPGDPRVQTGNHITNPVVWDNNACHTYWYVYFGQGNAAQNIFEGEVPPPPPPPPPAIISTREQCLAILRPVFCPKA
jgi:hypothetical protein